MTANAVQGDRERCAAAGMKDFVATPIESEQLWQALVRSMRPRQGLPVPAIPTAAAVPSLAAGTILRGLAGNLGASPLQAWPPSWRRP
ncbi:hypothetical protein [Pseudorhodoferax soli]|uniref:Response regulatory domain-containing protein n=1 Tax=Pseudorhodoferax soli TaxID=545864 RepID=A0A368X9J1_9BURK|nr:hypothetical protein [Pseudorhodoferax soli]RCW64515.1 hypothetical protein DES41_115139 [Pseudorhodoferax soli]